MSEKEKELSKDELEKAAGGLKARLTSEPLLQAEDREEVVSKKAADELGPDPFLIDP